MQFAVDVSTCCPVAEVEIRTTLVELCAAETTSIEKSESFEYKATFRHRGEAVFGNTCANGIQVKKSNKFNLFLNGPLYYKNY